MSLPFSPIFCQTGQFLVRFEFDWFRGPWKHFGSVVVIVELGGSGRPIATTASFAAVIVVARAIVIAATITVASWPIVAGTFEGSIATSSSFVIGPVVVA